MVSEKEAAERKQKIKISAYTLFQEKGVDDVSFANIAKHSGISESSIYHYFPKKSYLMLELNQYLWREIAAELGSRTTDVSEFQDACGYQQIELLINAFERVHLEHPGYLKFALECKLYWIRKKYVVRTEEYGAILAPVMQYFSDALKKGVDDKSVCLQSDYETCSFLLWGILRSYIEQMVVSDTLCAEVSRFSHYFNALKQLLIEFLKK